MRRTKHFTRVTRLHIFHCLKTANYFYHITNQFWYVKYSLKMDKCSTSVRCGCIVALPIAQ